jgi:hypothetical protein
MSPDVRWEQIVNLESWLWIDPAAWRAQSAEARSGWVTVRADAVPRRVVWDMGDGGRVACRGPGVAYDVGRPAESQSTDCSYTYRRASAGRPDDRYAVTATVEWGVQWSASGVDGGGALPTMTTSSQARVRVAELQALNR